MGLTNQILSIEILNQNLQSGAAFLIFDAILHNSKLNTHEI